MAVLISRKYLLLIFLSSMYQRSNGQCKTNLTNTVLREGESIKFSQPKCNTKIIPANNFFNQFEMVYSYKNGPSPEFHPSIVADQSGLTIVSASTSPANNKKWSLAGLYMMENQDDNCNAVAKVAVIKSGPTCQCNASTETTPAQYSCSITFADSPVSAMLPQYTLIADNGKDQILDVPVPKKCNRNEYESKTVFPSIVKGKGKGKGKAVVPTWKPKKCLVTFKAPAHSPFPSMATNAPTFTDSCSFNSAKCG